MRLTALRPDPSSPAELGVWSEAEQGWIPAKLLLDSVGSAPTLMSVLRDGALDALKDAARDYDERRVGEAPVFRNPCFAPIFPRAENKALCVGLNYADHALEFGDPVPNEPVFFNKAPSALS